MGWGGGEGQMTEKDERDGRVGGEEEREEGRQEEKGKEDDDNN